jgi:putative addiction module killer protein
MPTVGQTAEFGRWLADLRDLRVRAKVVSRLERLANGNPGDVAPIGDGLSEMRIDYGPGYRVYYEQAGDTVIVLFGGDKSTQSRDIDKAKALAKTLEGSP